MRYVRSLRSLTIVAACIAVVAELGLGALGRIPVWLIYPIALATGGIVLWIALAIDVLDRRHARPDPRDIAKIRDLLRSNAAALEDHDQRLAHADARLRLLAAEPALAKAERDLCDAAARIETWEALSEDIPAWNDAVARWCGIVTGLWPTLMLDRSPPSDAETKKVRAHLPRTGNFSSKGLKIALAYLVQRERILAVHEQVGAYRDVLTGDAPMTKAAPSEPVAQG